MVNKNDALYSTEWANLPIERQMAWRLPISLFFDIERMRREYGPVVTVGEYLALHGLDPNVETSNGAWDRERYHRLVSSVQKVDDGEENAINSRATSLARTMASTTNITLHVIPNEEYDPPTIMRVDHLPTTASSSNSNDDSDTATTLEKITSVLLKARASHIRHALDLDEAIQLLTRKGLNTWDDNEGGGGDRCMEACERVLNEAGWTVLETFQGE